MPDAARLDTQALQSVDHPDQIGLIGNGTLQHRLLGLGDDPDTAEFLQHARAKRAGDVGQFLGHTWARAVAVIVAAVRVLANFTWLPYYPIRAILVIAFDLVVIWAIARPHHRLLTLSSSEMRFPLDVHDSATAASCIPARGELCCAPRS